MASVAKWLRQRIVIPPFVGSIPIVRPDLQVMKVTHDKAPQDPHKASALHEPAVLARDN